jgi:hypothetical protein
MPATKVYSLFSQGVVNVACVVSKTGDFIGTLNRSAFTEQHIHDVLSQGPPASSSQEQDGTAKKIEQEGKEESKQCGAPVGKETGKGIEMKQFVESVRGGKPQEEVLHEILMTKIGKGDAFDMDDIAVQLMEDVDDFNKQLQSKGADSNVTLTV